MNIDYYKLTSENVIWTTESFIFFILVGHEPYAQTSVSLDCQRSIQNSAMSFYDRRVKTIALQYLHVIIRTAFFLFYGDFVAY